MDISSPPTNTQNSSVATTLFAVPTLSVQAQSVAPSFDVITTPPQLIPGLDSYSVSCPTWDFCMAVGNTSEPYISPDAMQWNGIYWENVSITGSLILVGALTGISCPTENWCMAVGYFGMLETPAAFIWQPNTGWMRSATGSLGSSQSTSGALNAISCTSETFCVAGGFQQSDTPNSEDSLVVEWNGTTWTTIPNAQGTVLQDSVYTLSCASKTFCMVAGEGASNFSIWNGTSWQAISQPNLPYQFDVSDLTCLSPNYCMGITSARNQVTPEIVWDGFSWSEIPSPLGSGNSFFSSVSCATEEFCVFVGGDEISIYNGSSFTNTSNTNGIFLSDVSCSSTSACIAVGTGSRSQNNVVAESWFSGIPK